MDKEQLVKYIEMRLLQLHHYITIGAPRFNIATCRARQDELETLLKMARELENSEEVAE